MDNKDFKTLIIDDTGYKTLYTKKYENRKNWASAKAEEIKTLIPGTVLEVNVKEGDKVAAGAVLCKFEAMKMQNIVCSPHAGIVRKLNTKQGDKLPKGFVMMLVEESK